MNKEHFGEARSRAMLSLAGLSVGDALGERFFGPPERVMEAIKGRVLPPPPWRYTDDTEMALSVVDVLWRKGAMDPDDLASSFARRFDPSRGYGSGAYELMMRLMQGRSWRDESAALFGQGSYGNGAAMRVAPLGAFFAPDLRAVRDNAILSAQVTHAHPEGVAGAVAVAVAAALAWQQGEAHGPSSTDLFAAVLDLTPPGQTRHAIDQASRLSHETPPEEAAGILGSGQHVSSQDTVPYALWCATRHPHSFELTFWATVAGLGDRDTTCAIACAIVALSARNIPHSWIQSREPLPPGFAASP